MRNLGFLTLATVAVFSVFAPRGAGSPIVWEAEESAGGPAIQDYDSPPLLARAMPIDAMPGSRAETSLAGAAAIFGSQFGRCPQIDQGADCFLIPHNSMLTTDDAGGLFIGVRDAQEFDGWTWRYYWPANSPDDGTLAPLGDCPTRILPKNHPDNPTGEVALIVYCSYPGGPRIPHPEIVFPSGCPCSFIFGIVHIIERFRGIEHQGAEHPGRWQAHIDYTDPTGFVTPDVVAFEFFVKQVPVILLLHGWRGDCGRFSDLEPWLEVRLVDMEHFPNSQLDMPDRVE